MNLMELQRALGQLRLGGMAAVLETRLRQAQAETMAPIDLISCLVSDELTRRSDRLLERRRKQAAFRDPQRTLDNFDFTFNPKMNHSLVFDLATCAFIGKREGAVRNVTVQSGDGKGRFGIALTRDCCGGPGYLANVTVNGFDYGIAAGYHTPQMGYTLEHVHVSGQNVVGIYNTLCTQPWRLHRK
jgi:IstB-like ATP binding protein